MTERIVSSQEIRDELNSRKKDLDRQRKRAKAVLKTISGSLESTQCPYGDVTGYTVSLRTKFGLVVSPLQYVIEIHVRRKLTDRVLAAKAGIAPIPKQIEGVPVKIIESNANFLIHGSCIREGDLVVRYDPENNNFHRLNPQLETTCEDGIPGGMPVFSMAPDQWGTLTIRIPTKPDLELIGLTNAHVAPENTRVIQPCVNEALTVDEIGEVKRGNAKYRVRPDGLFSIDAAIISLSGSRGVKVAIQGFDADHFWGLSDPEYFFAARRLSDDDSHTVVYKRGARIKEPVRGTIKDTDFDNLEIVDATTGVTRVFHNIIRVTSSREFVEQGDSGSAMLIPISHPREREKIALLVAGVFFARTSVNVGFACHFADIVAAFKLRQKMEPATLIRRWQAIDF